MRSVFRAGATAALVTATAAFASTAQAATIDFADFGNSAFAYGYGVTGSTFTEFSGGNISNCYGASGFTCRTITGNANGAGDLPAIGVTGNAAVSFLTTVDVPANTLYFHPGDADNLDAILRFTAPTTGNYTFSGVFSRLDNVPNSNENDGVTIYGASGPILLPVPIPNGAQYSGFSFDTSAFPLLLNQGDQVFIGVNRNSRYYNDSTGLTGSISFGAVPEPATWGMMILGFGMVGGAMRRRRTSVRFAAA